MGRRRLYWIILIVGFALLPGQFRAQTIQWQTPVQTVTTFSSPRVVDINRDSIKDIILGAGLEGEPSPSGIFAFDGADGSIIWQRYARDQIYGSPIFLDISGDSIPDIFITGRDAQFYALNGVDGSAIWQFWPDTKGNAVDSGWYNFYLPQWIPDVDKDGVKDILVTNGGDASASPRDTIRPPGYLMALSGKTGNILQVDTMQDGRETYHSPLIIDFYQNGNLQILFGSGGETVGGSYWKISLNAFLASGLASATPLLTNQNEGYIAVPSLADLTRDGIPDLIIPQLNEALIALKGNSNREIWRHTEPGADCYVSPTIGQFTGDDTPDVFAVFAEGNWPFYQRSIKLVIDGSNGQVVWSEIDFPFQMTSGNAIDWDNDGFDEIIYPKNKDISDTSKYLIHQFHLYDFNDARIDTFDIQRDGVILFSMPLITDLEDDQSLEMIFSTHDNTEDWYQPNGFTLYRMNLGLFREDIAWGGYLGTTGNGFYARGLQVMVDDPIPADVIRVYPNPVRRKLQIRSVMGKEIGRIAIFDRLGRCVLDLWGSDQADLAALRPGVYIYRVWVDEQSVQGKIVKL